MTRKRKISGGCQRWKYDADDSPAIEPEGTDEQDRASIDDYEPR
jgi:enhancer of polycomb-like protein